MTTSHQTTDEAIAALVQSGQSDFFAILVERYESKMNRYARRFLFGYEDSEDLVQEVFIKAYVNIQSFDPDRRFSPWLYRIAHNQFVNAIRKRKREPLGVFDADTIFPTLSGKERAEDITEMRERVEMTEQSLESLAPKYREPLVLYFFEDQSYDDIAEILRIPRSTVGVRINRAKQKLRSYFETNPYD